MNPLGTITRTKDGGTILCYERLLDNSPAQIWAAITDPAMLKRWLGDVEVDLRAGGTFIIRFHESEVVTTGVIRTFEPERLIEYSWLENCDLPPSLVRWSISSRGAQTRLTLTHILPAGVEPKDNIEFGAGWHAFLDGAAVALDGRDGIAVSYDKDASSPLKRRYAELFKTAPMLAIDGVLDEKDGELLVRFERLIDRPLAKVWTALTDPAILAKWLGDVEIEPRAGGKYVIRFQGSSFVMTGTITVFDPERVLEYTWLEQLEAPDMPQSLARWELSRMADKCRLLLTHRFPKGCRREDILPFLGGWEAFLDVLDRAADGVAAPSHSDEPYAVQYRAKYL